MVVYGLLRCLHHGQSESRSLLAILFPELPKAVQQAAADFFDLENCLRLAHKHGFAELLQSWLEEH
ncbi:hypothetical protein FOMPIDRAFT_1048041 [Fomitopsis schrenkii]|uniref:Uncharacterized protein n=1 Tax=Fomitopsis schrenkii TaxID=2126942 RepID=S8FLZ1_FOMSC|nr:hypothetical protein FOMPIDRAFT_1048041 [Fomitopsis schrenkii]